MMFRKMRRFKQQISEEECREVLNNAKRGVLSLLGEDGKLYFHGAKAGHKLEAIKKCDKASFCAYDEGYRKEGEWALNIKSVIAFGRISLVEDEAVAKRICTHLVGRFTDNQEYLEKELKNSLPRVQCLAMGIEHMTGKLVNES